MGVRDGAQEIGRRAGTALGTAARTGRAKARNVVGEGDWVRRALATLPPPEAPATEEWEVSIAALIGRHPRVPGPAVRLLHQLDGLGQVAFGPEKVGFDGEDVPWTKVQELRLHSTLDLLPDVVLDKEVDRIREFLPPVPGRKWVVARAAEGLLTLVMAAAEAAEAAGREERLLPCEIVHRGLLGRPRQLGGGLFAATALAALPVAADSLVATAKSHGVPVVPVEPTGTRADRAERLRAASGRLRDRVRTLLAEAPDTPEIPHPTEPPKALGRAEEGR
ncbi:hypothetical protein [Streptomyces sp. NRRL B-24484]|uniref:hypothetical protein n=1 Tax=Streptomyces sp. NRRL B-24484 TaxID=1463833 RepID=UPI0004C0B80E|nr:hypothetical protein [Streptomyces sp. NRRL B-24484]